MTWLTGFFTDFIFLKIYVLATLALGNEWWRNATCNDEQTHE
jgi:hypothetical protein